MGAIPEKVFAATDAGGKTFLDALREGGFKGTREAVATAKMGADVIGSYVEAGSRLLHIIRMYHHVCELPFNSTLYQRLWACHHRCVPGTLSSM